MRLLVILPLKLLKIFVKCALTIILTKYKKHKSMEMKQYAIVESQNKVNVIIEYLQDSLYNSSENFQKMKKK